MNLSRAKQIKGGGTRVAELEWLAEHAKSRLRIVELGTYHGRSTRAMLDNSEAHIWCIDRWKGPSGRAMVGEKDFQLFLRNISDIRDRVTILKMTTREAVGQLSLNTFDMVFIDADHSFEGAKFDIVHFASLLKPEGLLCGHDYNSKRWPGVIRAVKELAPKARVVHTIWWIKRPVGGFSWEISSDRS